MPTAELDRARVLGCPVDVVDMATAVARLVAMVERKHAGAVATSGVVITLNPEMVVASQHDPEFKAIIENAVLVTADGIGVVRALRRRGHVGAVRVTGADLFDAYLAAAAEHGHAVALIGGSPGIAELAAQRYRSRHPALKIVLADAGDPDRQVAARLRAAAPDVVAAAYGHGRQERFLATYLDEIGAAFGIGIGGTLDYAAGRVARAPHWVRRANLEWAWRLMREPSRWRRQLNLPLFWWRERQMAGSEGAVASASGRHRQ